MGVSSRERIESKEKGCRKGGGNLETVEIEDDDSDEQLRCGDDHST